MTFLTKQQQERIQLLGEQLAEAIAQFHSQTRQAELHKIIEQALANHPLHINLLREDADYWRRIYARTRTSKRICG